MKRLISTSLLAFVIIISSACANESSSSDAAANGSAEEPTSANESKSLDESVTDAEATTSGDEFLGTWTMVEMVENTIDEGSIFQSQVMKGGNPDPSAMNVSEYTKYEYTFKKKGKGAVSANDSDGNEMDIPCEWSYDEDAGTLTIATNLFVYDERVYTIVSMDGETLQLEMDFTYPEDDEFERGGQKLVGTYELRRN